MSSYNQFNSTLYSNSLSLNHLPSDFVAALNESLSKQEPIEDYQRFHLDNGTNQIPRIIHRTYKSADIPAIWSQSFNSCQNLHPNFTHYFWTDETARDFIRTEFEWFLPTYDIYPHTIQRVDALRYFLLWHYGGIYIDMDISCRRSLDPLLDFSAWVPKTHPYGVSNDLMASSPRHPLMIKVALSLQDHTTSYFSKYITVFFTTGPMFLNSVIANWFLAMRRAQVSGLEQTARGFAEPHGLAILPAMFYDSTDYSFFGHRPGSSWHGNDVVLVRWLYKHIFAVCTIIVILAMFTTIGFMRNARDNKRKAYGASKRSDV